MEVAQSLPVINQALMLSGDQCMNTRSLLEMGVKIKQAHNIGQSTRAEKNIPDGFDTEIKIHNNHLLEVLRDSEIQPELTWMELQNGVSKNSLFEINKIVSELIPKWTKSVEKNIKPLCFFTFSVPNMNQAVATMGKINSKEMINLLQGDTCEKKQWLMTSGITQFLNQKTAPWCNLSPITSMMFHTKNPTFVIGFEITQFQEYIWQKDLNNPELIQNFRPRKPKPEQSLMFLPQAV
jgi:hypothetical protein